VVLGLQVLLETSPVFMMSHKDVVDTIRDGEWITYLRDTFVL